MAESIRSQKKPVLADFVPLAVVIGGLFLAWCAAVVWLRQLPPEEGWVRQAFPLLLWAAAIALWIATQRPARPAAWLGLIPIGHRVIAVTAASFVVMFAWHWIRVALGRPPSGLLPLLPPEIFAWMFAGILANELLFHGVLQTRLSELLEPKFALPITAIVIVLFRLPTVYLGDAGSIQPVMLYSIFLLSLLAGVLRLLARSLWPAIALQAANALGTLL